MESRKHVDAPPRVSVIIPVYNAAPYLRRCLDSVCGQTFRNIEIICVDDGSTDGSAAILAACAARDVRVRVLSQANRGQGSARNHGMRTACGEYIYFVDADDELAALDMLERLVAVADHGRLDVLFFDAETCMDEGVAVPPSVIRTENYIRRHDYSSIYTGRELFARFLANKECTVSPCLVLLRHAFLEENRIRFPDERIFYEDNIFMTHVLLAAKRASHRPWRLYLRKVHANSTMTSRPTMRHIRGYLACYRDVCETLAHGGWDRKTRNVLRARRRIYKLNIRRLAEQIAIDADTARELAPILRYPLGEKMVNALHCLSERGVWFTVRRVLLGRQP